MDKQAELARIEARLQVIGNWLIQGRGNDDALWLEMRHLQAKRKALTAGQREAGNGKQD